MDKSKRLQEILVLGKRLVEELNLAEGVDTLSQWMAHYLSELIFEAQNSVDPQARKDAQGKVFNIILRIWKRRASLPGSAKPLGSLAPILTALSSLVNEKESWVSLVRQVRREKGNPWSEFLVDSYASDRRMAMIAALAAIAETAFGREKRWVKENEEMLTEEEKRLIHLLDSWLNSQRTWITIKDRIAVVDLPPTERTKLVLDELGACIAQQQDALKQLKKELRTSKPSVKQTANTPVKRKRKLS